MMRVSLRDCRRAVLLGGSAEEGSTVEEFKKPEPKPKPAKQMVPEGRKFSWATERIHTLQTELDGIHKKHAEELSVKKAELDDVRLPPSVCLSVFRAACCVSSATPDLPFVLVCPRTGCGGWLSSGRGAVRAQRAA